MDGRPVFKWAVRLLEDSSQQVLDAAGYTKEDVKAWLWHQANIRILDAASNAMEIDRRRVICNLDRYGNVGQVRGRADEGLRTPLLAGDLVVMCGFGGILVGHGSCGG
jgi:3-oxoacyl-[acyl-carrier-protein] synthase-3